MLVKYKRSEFMQIFDLLSKNMDKYVGKVAYAANKNFRLAKGEIEDIEAERKPSPEYTAYNKARIELLKELAKKKNGEPVIEHDSFVFEDEEAADARLTAFMQDSIAVINARQAQIEAYQERLSEEVEIDWYELVIDEKSLETLDGAAMFPIMEFLVPAPILEKK